MLLNLFFLVGAGQCFATSTVEVFFSNRKNPLLKLLSSARFPNQSAKFPLGLKALFVVHCHAPWVSGLGFLKFRV